MPQMAAMRSSFMMMAMVCFEVWTGLFFEVGKNVWTWYCRRRGVWTDGVHMFATRGCAAQPRGKRHRWRELGNNIHITSMTRCTYANTCARFEPQGKCRRVVEQAAARLRRTAKPFISSTRNLHQHVECVTFVGNDCKKLIAEERNPFLDP